MTDTQPHGSVSDGDGVVGALSATMHKDPPVVIDRAAFNQGVGAKYPPPHRGDGRDGHPRRAWAPCGDVVGAICARDHKGVGNECVAENKLVMEVGCTVSRSR